MRPLHAKTRERDKIAIRISNGAGQIVNPLDMIYWMVDWAAKIFICRRLCTLAQPKRRSGDVYRA